MPEIYGARTPFKTRSAADNFLRHVTRELTAGGLPHWCEIRREAPDRWIPIVHRAECAGGSACACGSSER
jgi:hypothetical protein